MRPTAEITIRGVVGRPSRKVTKLAGIGYVDCMDRDGYAMAKRNVGCVPGEFGRGTGRELQGMASARKFPGQGLSNVGFGPDDQYGALRIDAARSGEGIGDAIQSPSL